MSGGTKARFLGKVHIAVNGCWQWVGCTIWNGYGQFRFNGKTCYAHRVAYALFRGKTPAGLDLDHLCRNRACVNPKHLEPVTRRENLLRGKGVIALNAAKTHCPQNHALPKEPDRFGRRRCGMCKKAERVRYNEKRKLRNKA